MAGQSTVRPSTEVRGRIGRPSKGSASHHTAVNRFSNHHPAVREMDGCGDVGGDGHDSPSTACPSPRQPVRPLDGSSVDHDGMSVDLDGLAVRSTDKPSWSMDGPSRGRPGRRSGRTRLALDGQTVQILIINIIILLIIILRKSQAVL
jgi:hypothetical protein